MSSFPHLLGELFAAFLLAVLVLGGATWTSAHGPGPTSEVIHACVNDSSGTIKISENCNNNWSPLGWNATGPEGAQGPIGLIGARWPAGC